MLAIDGGTGPHLADRLRISRLVNLIKTLEFERWSRARNGKALRHRRALWQHSRKIGLRPDTREIDAAVMKAIGIDQSRNQTKRQPIAIHGVGGEQRPAGLELDGPKTVEFERRLAPSCKRRIRKLRGDVKAQGRAGMSRGRRLRDIPVPRKRTAVDGNVA